jgi:hypothetical protein
MLSEYDRWANGNIICNEEDQQLWGDHFLLPLRDMLSETCNNREVCMYVMILRSLFKKYTVFSVMV